ncbi:MAG: GAF domain-containing protein [Chloroflexota bacterium]
MNPSPSLEEENLTLKQRVAALESEMADMKVLFDAAIAQGTALENEFISVLETLSRVSKEVEGGEFDSNALGPLIGRADEFGQLGRVFLNMGHEVNAREKHLRMLKVVIPAGVALTVERDFNRLLETIVVEAQRLFNTDGGSLYIHRQTELEFLLARNDKLGVAFGGTTGKEANFPPLPLYDLAGQPNLKYAAVRCALTKSRIVVNDVYGDLPEGLDLSGARAFDREHNYHTQSMLVIPLLDSAGESVGVLQLINARDDSGALTPFHPDDVLETLTLLGATALSIYWREEKLRAEV